MSTDQEGVFITKKHEAVCALCGRTSEQTRVYNNKAWDNALASPDLDGRPASPLRETMCNWIEECPHCGYVNLSISHPYLISLSKLQEGYKSLGYAHINNLAKKFTKCGWLMEKIRQPGRAMQYLLRAAWACDDDDDEVGSYIYRKAAINAVQPHLTDKGPFASWGESYFVMLDMYRRTREFDRVIPISRPEMKWSYYDPINDKYPLLMDFQEELALKEDTAVHKMEEIPGYTKEMSRMLLSI